MEAIAHLRESISSEKNIKTSTLDAVRKGIDRIKMFEFLAPPNVLRELKAAEKALEEVTPQDVNGTDNSSFAKKLSEALESGLDQCRCRVGTSKGCDAGLPPAQTAEARVAV